MMSTLNSNKSPHPSPCYVSETSPPFLKWQRDYRALMLDPRVMTLLHDVLCKARTALPPLSSSAPPKGPSIDAELRAYRCRVAARVFHGLGSPRMPSTEWRESPFWSRYSEYKFEDIMDALMSF